MIYISLSQGHNEKPYKIVFKHWLSEACVCTECSDVCEKKPSNKKRLYWRMVARRAPVGAHNICILASLAETSCWYWIGLQLVVQVTWRLFDLLLLNWSECVEPCWQKWQSKSKVWRLLPSRALNSTTSHLKILYDLPLLNWCVGKSDMTVKEQSWWLTTLQSSATTAWCLLTIYCPYKRCFCKQTTKKSTSSETSWTDQTILNCLDQFCFLFAQNVPCSISVLRDGESELPVEHQNWSETISSELKSTPLKAGFNSIKTDINWTKMTQKLAFLHKFANVVDLSDLVCTVIEPSI